LSRELPQGIAPQIADTFWRVAFCHSPRQLLATSFGTAANGHGGTLITPAAQTANQLVPLDHAPHGMMSPAASRLGQQAAHQGRGAADGCELRLAASASQATTLSGVRSC